MNVAWLTGPLGGFCCHFFSIIIFDNYIRLLSLVLFEAIRGSSCGGGGSDNGCSGCTEVATKQEWLGNQIPTDLKL